MKLRTRCDKITLTASHWCWFKERQRIGNFAFVTTVAFMWPTRSWQGGQRHSIFSGKSLASYYIRVIVVMRDFPDFPLSHYWFTLIPNYYEEMPTKKTFQDVFDLMQCTLHNEALRALQSFIAIFWAFFRFQRILQLYAYITGTRIKSKIIPDFNFPDSLALDYTLKLN